MILVTGFCLIGREYRGAPALTIQVVMHTVQTMIRERGGQWFQKPVIAAGFYLLLVPALSLALISALLLGIHTQGIKGIDLCPYPH